MCTNSGTATTDSEGNLPGFIKEAIDNKKTVDEAKQLQADNPDALILTPSMSGDQSGSDNIAKVHRAEWEDYLSRFAPVENMLIDKFNDSAGRAEAVDKAGTAMASAFDRSKEQTDMNMSRYGLNISQDKQKQRDNEFALKKTAGVAGAKNGMRIAKEDQRMGIMAGGLSNVKQQNQGG